MRVRNNTTHNVSILARHSRGGAPARMVIPAGAMLELDDNEWLTKFEAAAQPSIVAGGLTIVKAPVSPLSAKEIAAAINDQAGVTVDARKPKAELQELASKLGVNITKGVHVVSKD